MLTPLNTKLDLDDLAVQLAGTILTPDDECWDDARRAWNLAVEQVPTVVGLPESAADIAAMVRWAAAQDMRVVVQGTGHAAASRGRLHGGLLINTSRMRGIDIDAQRRVARVAAGTLWQEVADAAAEHGLAALAGSSPDVGVVGYTLGGGLSWFARQHGLAANHVTAFEVVTAGGEILRADVEHEPDLFWALRGGGGSLAVVTAIEFGLFPVPELYAGMLLWPVERAREVLNA